MSESDQMPDPLDAVARRVGAAAVRADDPGGVFESLCSAVTDRYDLAWCGAVEDGSVAVRASGGGDRGALADASIPSDDDDLRAVLDGDGPVTVALDADGPDWARDANQRGFQSSAFAALAGRETVHGLLGVYDDDPTAFDDPALATLEEVGATAGHALDRFESATDEDAGFEEAVRRLPDPVDVKDRKGRYRAVNERFAVLFGETTDPDRVAGKTDEALFDPEDASSFRARDRRVAESGAVDTTDHHLSVDGREFVFETTRIPLQDGGVATVRRDVTDRVRRIEDLERKTDRLETFASVVSHDLRNPLDIAEGYVGKARETGDPEDFEEIATSIQRAKSLIDELLTLARADRQIDDTDEVSLGEVVEAAWNTVDTADATLRRDGDRQLTADEGQLQRLLANLFRNAVEHGARDGSVTVRVGTTGRGFFVADDGPGIPEDRHDRAFEPGYTTDADGTGLGLAIVGRIAEAHGWSASVSTAETGGARIDVDVDGE